MEKPADREGFVVAYAQTRIRTAAGFSGTCPVNCWSVDALEHDGPDDCPFGAA